MTAPHLALHAAAGDQLTLASARVIDPVLTTAARGYRNAQHIHQSLFPRVGTPARGGTRVEFDRTDFRKINSARAPGTGTREVQFGHEGQKFGLTQHRLFGKLPLETAEEAAQVPGIDLRMRTVDGTQALISLERELNAATLAGASGSYSATHVNTLAADARWDAADSTPTAHVMKAIETIRASIGMRPNTVVMGGAVYSVIRTHPEVRQQIRYKAGGKQIASKEDLAALWDVESVVVGDAISVDEDDAASDVWGKYVIVAYTAVGALSRAEPTFGYGYTLNGTPLVEQPYWDAKTNSWLYGVCEEWSNEIVGKDAGYLIATAIS